MSLGSLLYIYSSDLAKPTPSASQRAPALLNGAQRLQLLPDMLRNYLRLGLSTGGAERKLGGYQGFQTSS